MAWIRIYFTIFCLITVRISAKYSFSKKYGNRRLNDDPCSGSNYDCSDAAIRNQLFLEKYKEVMIDNNDDNILLDCSISSPENPSTGTKTNTLEYWYAVEATEDDTQSWSKILENKIFDIAYDQMSFCIMTGKRRNLSQRRLGILSVTSMPLDKHRSDVTCPSSFITGNVFCYAIQGKLRILSRASDDLSLTMVSMLDAIKNAMAPNTILMGPDIAMVKNVTYLGISEEDVKNFEISAIDSSNAVTPVIEDELTDSPVQIGVEISAALQGEGAKSAELSKKNEDHGSFLLTLLISAIIAYAILLLHHRVEKRELLLEYVN